RRIWIAILAQDARGAALPADSLPMDPARLGLGHRHPAGAGRAHPGAGLPRRERHTGYGDDRLDLSDSQTRVYIPRAFARAEGSGARVPAIVDRGLRRRMAYQADVPLPMELRGRHPEILARAPARSRRDPRP